MDYPPPVEIRISRELPKTKKNLEEQAKREALEKQLEEDRRQQKKLSEEQQQRLLVEK